jgi:hypothetical protein
MKQNIFRVDFIFSYWIVAWTLIYTVFPHKVPSPLLALYIALAINAIELLYIILFHYNTWTIIKFIGMIMIIKVLPIFIVYYYYNKKINLYIDLQHMAILFLFYNIYLFAQETNYYEVCKIEGESILRGENRTPMFKIFDTIYNAIKS